MKDPIWLMILGAVALAIILFVIFVDPATRPRVDTAYQGAWVVARDVDGITEYLSYVNVSPGLVADYRQEWTVLIDSAWKYGDKASAEADAKVSMGEARPLRGKS